MLTPQQEETLHRLVEIFLQENQIHNLSALRTEEACWIGNVLDSLAINDIWEEELGLPSPPPSGEGLGVGGNLESQRATPPSRAFAKEEENLQMSGDLEGQRATPPSPALPPEGEGGRKPPMQSAVLHHARTMRKNPTKAEELLWEHLRGDSVDYKFRRQHPVGTSIIDFYCHEARLGIEIDGSIHQTPEQKEYDRIRAQKLLDEKGIRLLRFWNSEVLDRTDSVLLHIQKELLHSPPPSGEGLGVGDSEGGRVIPPPTTPAKDSPALRVATTELQEDPPPGALPSENDSPSLLDIGTGGGFPLLPIAITHPEIHCTGLDATQKKIDAIARIVSTLNLRNLTLLTARTEQLGQDPQYREQYDIVTARAVAPLNVLLEYMAPFAKPGGKLVCWKSLHIDQELQDSLAARSALHCHLVKTHRYTLPGDWGERQLLVFKKTSPTPSAYPRAVGTPKKSPLA